MTLNISGNFIAQSSHVGWGYIFTTAPILMFHTRFWLVALAVVGLTGLKELWDANGLESKELAGNSWEDWAFWIIGTLLALTVLALSSQVKL
jgi:hypothetical protein